MQKIHFLNCGGTIDKTYNPSREVFEHQKTHISEIFEISRADPANIFYEELFLKDSLDMFQEDFDLIVEKCLESEFEKILIMHGTSRMEETARLLSKKMSETNKTVVLFGSMFPFEHPKSDALFNFGFAFSAVKSLENGIFVAMNGEIFSPQEAHKNIELARFEKI